MRIAVTGAAGSLGGRVVRLLADRPDADVVAMTRRKLPAEAFPPGVVVAVADYGDRAAPKGVDTLVFVSGDGPDARVLLHHRNVVAAVAAEPGLARRGSRDRAAEASGSGWQGLPGGA
ncbi:NAD(P)H-binding protein [Streptomyces sp. NPDC047097]|uniref:NAD(P)H-binding protein n=1 Tax=Streptomyces sp. NPDC047097 TaxID=3155260 RepID=UPI0033C2196A